MKESAKILLIVIASLIAGAMLDRCQNGNRMADGNLSMERDTVRIHDTITVPNPTPLSTAPVTTLTKFIPILRPNFNGNNVEEIIPDSGNIAIRNISDSVAELEIPITQTEYADTNYRAWVSGYEARLDSLHIHTVRETVTIREPPGKRKRWGIGLYVGYGMTPQGLQPSAGVSINYNLWNF